MQKTAQPQAGEPANQPDLNEAQLSAEESPAGGIAPGETEAKAKDNGADESYLTVRYNKEDKPLSKEEAVTFAQKGMNYDKLCERLKEANAKLSEYENDGFIKAAKEYAKNNSISTEQAANALKAQLEAGSEGAKQALIDGQLEDFMSQNPGVDPRSLPDSVIGEWKKGVPLSQAYLVHEKQQLKSRIEAMQRQAEQAETNNRNAASSMGSAVSNGRTRGRQLSDESIRNMTPEELDKNHERIWTYLTTKKG